VKPRAIPQRGEHHAGLRQRYLLVLVNPIGPTCHKGTTSCFGETGHQWLFLYQLEQLLA
jgi:hypothetical protein